MRHGRGGGRLEAGGWRLPTTGTRKLAASALSALVVIIAGCGGPTVYKVDGTVKYDGAAVESGVIRFEDPTGKVPPAEAVITGGKYELEVQPGEKKVLIYGNKKIGEKRAMGPDSPMLDITEQYIPAKYNDQTQEQRTVKGSETFDFNLEP